MQLIEARAGAGSAIADPGLGVRGDILPLSFDHPGVDPGRVGPGEGPRQSVGTRVVLPVAEQLSDPTGSQVPDTPAHDGGDEVVTGHPAISVVVFGNHGRPGGDDERRVGHDEVEVLASYRFEQIAAAELDVGHAVELSVHRRDQKRALGDVGRNHSTGVPRGVQGLDAAPGAQVEHGRHRCRHHQRTQRHRRATDSEYMI